MSDAAGAIEMRRVFADALLEIGRADERVVVLDNDSGLTKLSDPFKQAIPERYIDLGIAEKNVFGTAAGLAASGFIPYPTVFAAFAARCANDQLAISICYPALNVKIPGHYIGGSRAGASHIAIEDLALMRALPNIRVADPADGHELRAVMRAAHEIDGPVYYRVSKLAVPDVFDAGHSFAWGHGVVLRDGVDVTLFATGMMTAISLRAADLLAADGVRAEVVHLASIKPIDADLIVASIGRTGCAVAAENASINGGFGSAVAEVLAERRPAPLQRVGYRDRWVHSGPIGQILTEHGMRPSDIATAARASIAARRALRIGARA